MSDPKNDPKNDNKAEQPADSAPGTVPRNAAEWVSLIVSLCLLAAVIGAILWLQFQDQGKPAAFRVDKGTARKAAGGYYLPVTVTNTGDATGAEVAVCGELAKTGAGTEEAATTFDFIPAHATVEGVLIFRSDPSKATVTVRSYQPP